MLNHFAGFNRLDSIHFELIRGVSFPHLFKKPFFSETKAAFLRGQGQLCDRGEEYFHRRDRRGRGTATVFGPTQ